MGWDQVRVKGPASITVRSEVLKIPKYERGDRTGRIVAISSGSSTRSSSPPVSRRVVTSSEETVEVLRGDDSVLEGDAADAEC